MLSLLPCPQSLAPEHTQVCCACLWTFCCVPQGHFGVCKKLKSIHGRAGHLALLGGSFPGTNPAAGGQLEAGTASRQNQSFHFLFRGGGEEKREVCTLLRPGGWGGRAGHRTEPGVGAGDGHGLDF